MRCFIASCAALGLALTPNSGFADELTQPLWEIGVGGGGCGVVAELGKGGNTPGAGAGAAAPLTRQGLSAAVNEVFLGNLDAARLDGALKVKKVAKEDTTTWPVKSEEGAAPAVAAETRVRAATATATTTTTTTTAVAVLRMHTSPPSDPRKRATGACIKGFVEDDVIILDDEDEQFAISPEPSTRVGGHPHLDLVPLLSDEEEEGDLQILPDTPVSAGGSEFDPPVGRAPATAAVKSNLSIQAQVSHPEVLPQCPFRPASITPALQALIDRRRLPLLRDRLLSF